jgi:hypothetical protein
MRNFNEVDKKKKQARIQIKENLGDLSKDVFAQLEDMVKASLRDGNLQCAAAFKIARQAKVPLIAVGEMTDRLGIRITNCQIGCFKVDKIIHNNLENKKIDGKIVTMLETLRKNDELTCANVFELSPQLKLTPMAIADVANLHNLKIHRCQLGCF